MLRSWDLNLELSKDGSALYMQITEKIIAEIQQGRLQPETAMPSTRYLALLLSVNRKTVVLSYDELIAQGWLVAEKRRGTFVSNHLPNFSQQTLSNGASIKELVSTSNNSDNQLKKPTSRNTNHTILDFSEALTDPRLIPFDVLARAFRRALVSQSRSNYIDQQDPRGNFELRTEISAMLNMERALHIGPNNVCLVTGSQMGFYIASRILTKRDDIIVFESQSNPAIRSVFKASGAKILEIDIDDEGMCVDKLSEFCEKYPIRAVFVSPQYQYPTTVTLSNQRRKKLVRLADQYNFTIIEDDHDHAFNFSKDSVFPLASNNNKIVYIGSLSKVLSQGLRVGYIVGTESFIAQCAAEVLLIDRQGDSASELALSELMRTGEIKRHIRRMNKIYLDRRDILRDAIHDELYPWVSLYEPKGGLAFWLKFKKIINFEALIQHAMFEKVKFSNSTFFSDSHTDVQGIRLNFARFNEKELIEGVKRIKRALITYSEFDSKD